MNQINFIGNGCIKNINKIIKKYNSERILLVTGKNSFTSSGAKKALLIHLKEKHVIKFNDFSPNPKLEDVEAGVKTIKDNNPDIIIAIGGGSVIDMGKLINISSFQEEVDIKKIIKDNAFIKNKGLPFVAIPTTAGTGSEATHFAVIYIKNKKYSLAHPYILPNHTIIETKLNYFISSKTAATSAMDALSQSIESYWSINSTKESKKYASYSIRKILPIVRQAINEKNNIHNKNMALAAHLSGKAINITKTTAPHAISYPITTHFNIPHGHAVALTLGKFFTIHDNISLEVNDKRGRTYIKKTMNELYNMLGCSNSQECHDIWYELMNEIGLETNFKSLGICNKRDIDLIIDNINRERLVNHPVKINRAILYKTFNSL